MSCIFRWFLQAFLFIQPNTLLISFMFLFLNEYHHDLTIKRILFMQCTMLICFFILLILQVGMFKLSGIWRVAVKSFVTCNSSSVVVNCIVLSKVTKFHVCDVTKRIRAGTKNFCPPNLNCKRNFQRGLGEKKINAFKAEALKKTFNNSLN